ncbi:MAG TPA: 3'-5' exonuclease [Bacteroidetes bacterium]|nr:3'-5' exonuclease [Bacteroidota bacterium]
MYTRHQLENILFLDIETASAFSDYGQLPDRLQELWLKKAKILNKREEEPIAPEDLFRERAAIFAEFGKTVCISCGYIRYKDDKPTFRLKSYFGEDEKQLLAEFTIIVNQFMNRPERNLCAHNGKEFDFPYLGRRYLINGLPLPGALAAIQNSKPWEIRMIDTMILWKFGDYKNYTSLDLICAVLGVPSPKDDINGSEVGRVFWEEKDYARIARYCEKDVLATAQVLLRMSREPLIEDKDVTSN